MASIATTELWSSTFWRLTVDRNTGWSAAMTTHRMTRMTMGPAPRNRSVRSRFRVLDRPRGPSVASIATLPHSAKRGPRYSSI